MGRRLLTRYRLRNIFDISIADPEETCLITSQCSRRVYESLRSLTRKSRAPPFLNASAYCFARKAAENTAFPCAASAIGGRCRLADALPISCCSWAKGVRENRRRQ